MTRVSQIRDRVLAELKEFEGCSGLYFDYPLHSNVGDLFIWLGTEQWFQTAGVKIKHRFNITEFNFEALKITVSAKDVLFFHGGGNFGDLYLRHTDFRNKIIRAFPDNPVVVLPQTIYFTDENKLKETAAIYNAHNNLLLCVREYRSHEIAKKHFQGRIKLVPDMAFCLPMQRDGQAIHKKLLFLRKDKESCRNFKEHFEADHCLDWSDLKHPNPLETRLLNLTRYSIVKVLRKLDAKRYYYHICALNYRIHLTRALNMTRYAVSLFSSYEYIISDRLHGHIIATMLGIPNLLLDNVYFKNRSFYKTWIKDISHTNYYHIGE